MNGSGGVENIISFSFQLNGKKLFSSRELGVVVIFVVAVISKGAESYLISDHCALTHLRCPGVAVVDKDIDIEDSFFW